MAAGKFKKMTFKSKKVQKVVIVKPRRRRRRGPKLGALLKKKMMVKLRYVDTVSLNAGSAAIVNHNFSANGIFDPDVTGTGHQPLLHDEYALLYARYRVTKSTIKVTPIVSATTNQIPALWGCFLDDNGTLSYSSATQAIEDKTRTKQWRLMEMPLNGANNNANNRPIIARFNSKRDVAKDFDVGSVFGANPTGNPTTQFYVIWSGSILGNDPGLTEFMVELEYTCELTEPLVVTPS